jgi:glycosyltransferase involved in cell wall biosynthesis
MTAQFPAGNDQLIEMVSVIVPTSRGMAVKPTVIALLAQQTRFALEIILVCPEGAVLKALKNDDRVIIHEAGSLFPPGQMRNLGASVARGRYLFFIDDDCVPPLNWIEKECNCIDEDERRGAVGCRVVGTGEGFWNRCADFALFAPTQYQTAGNRELGAGAIAVRFAAFREVSGFDPILLGSEDWDFCLKLRGAGWSCYFDPTVEVVHDHRRGSMKAILRSAFRSGKASGLTVQRRNFSKMSWLARLAVRMGTPPRYLLMVLPYAFAVSLLNLGAMAPKNSMLFLYFPFVLMAQISFHIGVFFNVVQEGKSSCRL